MGFYCIKQRKTVSENTEFYLDKETNKLELYLSDVYEKECVFKIQEGEVNFIQTGIETLVKSIADWLSDYFQEQKLLPDLDKGLCEILKNRGETECQNEIIKVGSFFEGTRNGFPDEFDFIFPLYSSDSSIYYNEEDNGIHIPGSTFFHVFMSAYTGLSHVTEKYRDFLYYKTPDGNSKISFDKYIDAKGPAAKLLFVYECGSCDKRDIPVDFVPAVKVIGNKLKQTVDIMCNLPEFHSQILHTGSYFLVGTGGCGITFTETEAQFMKNVLSKNHAKVYRILKYLVNGNEDSEILANYLRARKSYEKVYSSYMLKTMIICHHFNCTNTDPTEIGPCILEVLHEMCGYADIESFPFLAKQLPVIQQKTSFRQSTCEVMKRFFYVEDLQYTIPLVPYLQSMTVYLRSMQQTEGNSCYDYQKDKMRKSVSQMYLDDLRNGVVQTKRSMLLEVLSP